MSTPRANTTRLYILLVLWCVFMLAPGALMVLDVFGKAGARDPFTGMQAISWVLFYLAQFAIFMWMMAIVDTQRFLWWFVASALPWGIDWTVPVSPWFLSAGFVITAGFAVRILMLNRSEDSLLEHGIQATGTVLEVFNPAMNVVVNKVYIQRRLRVRIERSDGAAAYEGIYTGLFMLGEIPGVGDTIPLLVDPANPQRFEYDKSAGAQPAQRASSTPSSVPSSDASRPDIAGELERLSALRDRGALSDAEFDAAKKKLLNS